MGDVCLVTSSDGESYLFSLHSALNIAFQKSKSKKMYFDPLNYRKVAILHSEERKDIKNGTTSDTTTNDENDENDDVIQLNSIIDWRCFVDTEKFEFSPNALPLSSIACCLTPSLSFSSLLSSNNLDDETKNSKSNENLPNKRPKKAKKGDIILPQENEVEVGDIVSVSSQGYQGLTVIGSSTGLVRCHMIDDTIFKTLSL